MCAQSVTATVMAQEFLTQLIAALCAPPLSALVVAEASCSCAEIIVPVISGMTKDEKFYWLNSAPPRWAMKKKWWRSYREFFRAPARCCSIFMSFRRYSFLPTLLVITGISIKGGNRKVVDDYERQVLEVLAVLQRDACFALLHHASFIA